MSSALQRIGTIGVVLALVGAVGFAGGSYLQANSQCVSETALHITHATDEGHEYSETNVREFDSLSPLEQRIFLEAHTSQYGVSRSYENWSRSWFDGFQIVEYRGERYEVSEAVTACSYSEAASVEGFYLKLGGIAAGMSGGLLLGIAGVRRGLR